MSFLIKLKFIIIVLCLSYLSSSDASFLSFDLGYEQFATYEMSNNNASSNGVAYQLEYGIPMRHSIVTFFLRQSDLNTKVLHDDIEREFESSSLSYGFKTSFMITFKTYLSVGFNLSKIKNDLSKLNNYTSSGIKSSYNLDDVQNTTGMILGVGRNLFKRKSSSFFVEYNYIDHSNIGGKSHLFFLGYRFRSKLGI